MFGCDRRVTTVHLHLFIENSLQTSPVESLRGPDFGTAPVTTGCAGFLFISANVGFPRRGKTSGQG